MSRIQLACGRIPDKTLFKAVVFAVHMIREGTPPYIATGRAAGYYRVKTADVAYYTGLHAARVKEARSGRERARREEEES